MDKPVRDESKLVADNLSRRIFEACAEHTGAHA